MTPELLDATRRNARRSNGPSSPAGKAHVKMNALKHGIYAAPENEPEVMRALGEDPLEFELLKGDLKLTYGPGDPLWLKQLDDLLEDGKRAEQSANVYENKGTASAKVQP